MRRCCSAIFQATIFTHLRLMSNLPRSPGEPVGACDILARHSKQGENGMLRKTFARFAVLAGTLLFATFALAQTPSVHLTIQADQPIAPVSPTLYGLMTEEINFSYEGGLYAELVRNRTFRADWSGILYWYLVENGSAAAKMETDKETGPSDALKTSLRLEVEKASAGNEAGVLNVGYWGIAVRPNT